MGKKKDTKNEKKGGKNIFWGRLFRELFWGVFVTQSLVLVSEGRRAF